MKIRIDLKILIFFAVFYFTNQLSSYFIIMFFSLIHEIGHIIMGLILKMKPLQIEIMPFGVSAAFEAKSQDLEKTIKNGNLLEMKNILVACAGPMMSLGLVILYIFWEPFYISKQSAIYSNLLIILFNLIPIFPLDGGRIIKSIIHIHLGRQRAEYIVEKITDITLTLLTILSSIAVFYYKNVAIFLVCIFLWWVSVKEKNSKTLDILPGK